MSIRINITRKVDQPTKDLLSKQVHAYYKTHEDMERLELKLKKKIWGPYIAVFKGTYMGEKVSSSGQESSPAKAFLEASRRLHKRINTIGIRQDIEDAIHGCST